MSHLRTLRNRSKLCNDMNSVKNEEKLRKKSVKDWRKKNHFLWFHFILWLKFFTFLLHLSPCHRFISVHSECIGVYKNLSDCQVDTKLEINESRLNEKKSQWWRGSINVDFVDFFSTFFVQKKIYSDFRNRKEGNRKFRVDLFLLKMTRKGKWEINYGASS